MNWVELKRSQYLSFLYKTLPHNNITATNLVSLNIPSLHATNMWWPLNRSVKTCPCCENYFVKMDLNYQKNNCTIHVWNVYISWLQFIQSTSQFFFSYISKVELHNFYTLVSFISRQCQVMLGLNFRAVTEGSRIIVLQSLITGILLCRNHLTGYLG